jgi:hypothetical protein
LWLDVDVVAICGLEYVATLISYFTSNCISA